MESKQQIRLNFAKPEKGIIAFDVTIEASDNAEAVQCFVDYLTELKKLFLVPPSAINGAKGGDVARELLRRIYYISDPIAYVLTLHLFCEYWINRIVLREVSGRDLTRYDFFKKLEIALGLNKITTDIFVNLCQLNTLRTEIAHNPSYDLTKMPLGYRGCDKPFELSQFKPSFSAASGPHHIFNVLHGIAHATYYPLHQHCVKVLGFDGPEMFVRTEATGK